MFQNRKKSDSDKDLSSDLEDVEEEEDDSRISSKEIEEPPTPQDIK